MGRNLVWLVCFDLAGMAAARPPRLSLHVHEARDNCSLDTRNFDRAAPAQDARAYSIRRWDGARIFRQHIPILLRNNRVRSDQWFSFSDCIGHYPKAHFA